MSQTVYVIVGQEAGTEAPGDAPASVDATIETAETQAVGKEEAANPILPVAPELLWGGACFLVLWALLKFVLLKPVLKTMEDRDAKVRDDLAAAERAGASVEQVLADYHASLATARAEGNRIVEDARAQGEARRREILAEAEADAAALRAATAAEIADAKAAALGAVRGDVAGIATEAASTVIGRPLDPAAHRSLVDDYLARN